MNEKFKTSSSGYVPLVKYEFRVREIKRYVVTMYMQECTRTRHANEKIYESGSSSQVGEFPAFYNANLVAESMAAAIVNATYTGLYNEEGLIQMPADQGKEGPKLKVQPAGKFWADDNSLSQVDDSGFSYGQLATGMSTVHNDEVQECKQHFASVIDRLRLQLESASTSDVAHRIQLAIDQVEATNLRVVHAIG